MIFDANDIKVWWWSIDKWIFFSTVALIFIGFFLILSSSGSFESRYKLNNGYLIQKQLIFIPLSLILLIGSSMLSKRNLIKFSFFFFFIFLFLSFATIFLSNEIQGAKRWLKVYGLTLQPSEFLKPIFTIVSALLLNRFQKKNDYSLYVNFIFFFLVGSVLILQPDFGMLILFFFMWFIQILLSGISIKIILMVFLAGFFTSLVAFFKYEHVRFRIQSFFNSSLGDNYQINKSLDALSSGGFFGKGLGSGDVSERLPDVHSDFIFSLAGEELGLLFLIFLISIYILIFTRVIILLVKENNLFVFLSSSGLIVIFIIQCLINICSALNLIPTKGMTLPFLSYGGSSLISCSLIIGFILCLTKKKVKLNE